MIKSSMYKVSTTLAYHFEKAQRKRVGGGGGDRGGGARMLGLTVDEQALHSKVVCPSMGNSKGQESQGMLCYRWIQ